ncbi:MAG TPA: hypothetical protein VMV10_30245 [Pirellulales bacterium]|nr:hypothetical protein [Pirellulales bacterium]
MLPATLAQALAQALQANPDVLLAEAKVRQAQAEYNQAKLKAAQDVTVAFHERGAAQRSLETHREARMKIPGSVPEPEIQRLADELAECEAKMTYLLGAGAELKQAEPSDRKETIQLIPHPIRILHENRAVSDATANQDAGKQTPRVVLEPLEKVGTLHVASHPGSGAPAGKRPGIPEKYRKVLQKPVKVKFKDMNVDQIVEQLNRLTGDELPILLPRQQFGAAPLTIELPKEVSLQTALEAVADMSECAFLFRDYGLLVVNRSFVPNYPPSATIPELP